MNHEQNSSPTRQRSNGNAPRSAVHRPARANGAVTAAQFKRLSERVEQMEGELHEIKRALDRMGTSREQIEKNAADLSVQFQRIAMIQADIDRLKASERAFQTGSRDNDTDDGRNDHGSALPFSTPGLRRE